MATSCGSWTPDVACDIVRGLCRVGRRGRGLRWRLLSPRRSARARHARGHARAAARRESQVARSPTKAGKLERCDAVVRGRQTRSARSRRTTASICSTDSGGSRSAAASASAAAGATTSSTATRASCSAPASRRGTIRCCRRTSRCRTWRATSVELGVARSSTATTRRKTSGPRRTIRSNDDRVSFCVDYTDVEGRAIVRPKPWLQAGTRVRPARRHRSAAAPTRDSRRSRNGSPTRPRRGWPSSRTVRVRRGLRRRRLSRSAGQHARRRVLLADLARILGSRLRSLQLPRRRHAGAAVRAHLRQEARVRRPGPAAVRRDRRGRRPARCPFYFKPTIGGSTSQRGFNDFRFRDDAVVYFNAEYRWEAFSGLDMALFSDWGTVAPNVGQPEAVASSKNAYGIGFRFNTDKTVLLPRRHRIRRRRRHPILLQVQQGLLRASCTHADRLAPPPRSC